MAFCSGEYEVSSYQLKWWLLARVGNYVLNIAEALLYIKWINVLIVFILIVVNRGEKDRTYWTESIFGNYFAY